MTVGELITLLAAQAAQLPDGLDSQVIAGVEDDEKQFAGIYAAIEVATWPMPRRGAVLVRGTTTPSRSTIAEPGL